MGSGTLDNAGMVYRNDEITYRNTAPVSKHKRSTAASNHQMTFSREKRNSHNWLLDTCEASYRGTGTFSGNLRPHLGSLERGNQVLLKLLLKNGLSFLMKGTKSPFRPTAMELLIFLTSLLREGKT